MPRRLALFVLTLCLVGPLSMLRSNATTPANANPPLVTLASVTAISAGPGGGHTCALMQDSGVKCWGMNAAGQLGNVTSGDHVKMPVDVCSTGPGLYCGRLTGATAIASGGAHSCALLADSSVVCWGLNDSGQLGNGTTMDSVTPVEVCVSGSGLGCGAGAPLTGVTSISAGAVHTCALLTTRGVMCWGSNFHGQLGDGRLCGSGPGELYRCPNPVQVSGLSGGAGEPQVTNLAASGNLHMCVLADSPSADYGVKCWGSNTKGQLGDGTVIDRYTPVDVCASGSGGGCAPLAGVARVAAGGANATDPFTCAQIGGQIKCWGGNRLGQLGDGQACGVACPAPVDVCAGVGAGCSSLLGGVTTFSLGLHVCAVLSDSSVRCWGYNAYGELGIGSIGNVSTPVVVCVAGPSGEEATCPPNDTLSGIASVAAAYGVSCALAETGGVTCWGRNSAGQVGDGTSCCSDGVRTTSRWNAVAVVLDSDRDGCTDTAELNVKPDEQGAPPEEMGGLRNPADHWDFMDQWVGEPATRDRIISVGDIGAVNLRFGASGNATGDPLTPPGSANGYHASADRSGSIPGQHLWNLLPPDGIIAVGDIGAVVAQFGHSCL